MRIKATFLTILKTRVVLGFSCITLVYFSTASAAPNWFHNTKSIIKDDEALINCSGKGISFDVARKEALYNCQSALNQQIRKNVTFHNVTIQTMKETGYHEELNSSESYKSLTCETTREKFEETTEGFKVWLRCKFKFNGPKVVTKKLDKTQNGYATLRAEKIEKRPSIIDDESKVLLLSVNPYCDQVLIQGKTPRTFKCDSNPIELILYKSDTSIIIQRTGFLTERVSVADIFNKDTLTVTLDRLTKGPQ